MSTQLKSIEIRTRKLGLLIADSRQAAGKTVEQCAQAMAVSPDIYQSFEAGEQAPSLPQLEGLAYFLNLPLEHFWGNSTVSGLTGPEPLSNIEPLLRLRQRVIGTMLRMARVRMNLSLPELAAKTSLEEDCLDRYERGEIPIPLPELEVLADTLGMRIEEFFDKRGPVGAWRTQQQNVAKFLELSPEIQAFVSSPVNTPYLQLAMRLSELNVEKLRTIAESLLEITY
jgi:transcriptional regulator with XRE-family HTH domain